MTLNKRTILIIAAVLLAAAAIYFTFSPTDSIWFPRCSFKLLTGYNCPSCGAQRAFHAALHGHFTEAIRYNFFLLVGIPYLLAAVVASLGSGRISTWTSTHLLSSTMLWIYVALYCLWWILRNILGL